MKFAKRYFIAVPLVILLFSSCDKIKAPYALARHGNISDTVIDWQDTVHPIKRVLLEDYTGHKCPNCPAAATIAHSQEEKYHGKLIVLAVHAGYYAIPGSGEFAADFRTTAGEEWNTDFLISAYPSGMIDRKEFNGHRILGSEEWITDIAGIIDQSPDLNMLIHNTYDSVSRTVNSVIYSQFLRSITGSYNITVCVMEDNIISAQDSVSIIIHNYIFNGVLRGSVNGTYGEILTTSVDPSLTYMGKFSIAINTAWVAKNCWILAFVSKSDTREIIQVIKKKVITQ
jgi:Outer membrane protein Omp28